MKYEDDEMDQVYTAVLDCDVLFPGYPHPLEQPLGPCPEVRGTDELHREPVLVVRQSDDKKQGRGLNHHRPRGRDAARGGKPLNFFSWLGFHSPEVSITSWVGENNEDTTKDWEQIENNPYTQQDLTDMVNSSLRLACSLKREV